MTRVLAVASEIFPLVKTGGLADVTGALPLALRATGIETTTVVPGYPSVLAELADARIVHRFADLFGGPADVLHGSASGLDLLAIDAPHLYARPGNPYIGPDGHDWPDNDLRFAGLGAAAAALAVGAEPRFDVVHAHDWQAALTAAYLHFHPGRRPGTVLTVHNLAFQGMFPASVFPRLGLPASAFNVAGLEFYNLVGFLKAGLVYADRLTTVSPSYAREILLPENGAALDGVLRQRADVLSGILNGIDDVVWNPATDPLIPSCYTAPWLARRAVNKSALQRRMGLAARPDAMLVGVVSRLTYQKGFDLLLGQLDRLAGQGIQLAVLGSGDPAMEQAFTAAAAARPDLVACVIGYDEILAHLIQAGSDALLVPSRFEPCGLTQLCALRYGAIPIVARVGGLADTVIDANEAALARGVATGIQFAPVTADALTAALDRAGRLWEDRVGWQRMQRNAMAADVSWRGSAERYAALYRALEVERA
ncbi:glycogen synthase GlgA [Rhodopila sp.]|uniref:glycogen synthase GlgA n=1 Tax=Rhodopila sp. TaxID=2480087 RepID=UPI003D114B50